MIELEQKTTRLLISALSAIMILSMFNFLVQPSNEASFITVFNPSLNGSNNQCVKMQGANEHIFVCIPNESAQQFHKASWMVSNVTNPTVNSFTIYPQLGGCGAIGDNPFPNPALPCSSGGGLGDSGGSAACSSGCAVLGHTGILGGLWCGTIECYTIWQATDSYSNQILRFNPLMAGIDGYMNITSSTKLKPLLTGVDTSTGNGGGGSLYYIYCSSVCTTGSIGTFAKVGIGGSIIGVASTLTTNEIFLGDGTTTLGWGIRSMDSCWRCDGNVSNTALNNDLIVITSGQGITTNRQMTVYEPDTMVELCGVTGVSGSLSEVSTHTSIARIANATRFYYATDGSIYSFNIKTCAKAVATSYATFGLANYVSAIYTNSSQQNATSGVLGLGFHAYNGVFWVHSGNYSSSQATLTQLNANTFNSCISFDTIVGCNYNGYIGGGQAPESLTADIYAKTLFRADNSVRGQEIFLTSFNNGQGSNNPQTVCFDINPTGTAAILTCFTCPNTFGTPQAISAACPHGYPTTINTSGIPPAFRGSMNGSQQINAYGCATGYFSCSNQNLQTNGLGYVTLIILIVASTFILLYATFKTGHEIKEVTFPILLVDTLWTAVTWQVGFTPPTPFYLALLVFAGIFGFKVFERVTGRDSA